MNPRPYESVAVPSPLPAEREARARALVDALWNALCRTRVSWIGVYVFQPPDALVLGPARNKPACSPIGLHGACGQALGERRPLIVTDVRRLGPNYIACDPRDLSELVVPLFDPRGDCWAVLDLDSFEVNAFDESDADGIRRVLERFGLAAADDPIGPPRRA